MTPKKFIQLMYPDHNIDDVYGLSLPKVLEAMELYSLQKQKEFTIQASGMTPQQFLTKYNETHTTVEIMEMYSIMVAKEAASNGFKAGYDHGFEVGVSYPIPLLNKNAFHPNKDEYISQTFPNQ